ncbi:hypothetical protein L9F63_014013, partial [Diploptera punctata]
MSNLLTTVIIYSSDDKKEAVEKGEVKLQIFPKETFNSGQITHKPEQFLISLSPDENIESGFSAILAPMSDMSEAEKTETEVQTNLTCSSDVEPPFKDGGTQTVLSYTIDRSNTSIIKELKSVIPKHDDVIEEGKGIEEEVQEMEPIETEEVDEGQVLGMETAEKEQIAEDQEPEAEPADKEPFPEDQEAEVGPEEKEQDQELETEAAEQELITEDQEPLIEDQEPVTEPLEQETVTEETEPAAEVIDHISKEGSVVEEPGSVTEEQVSVGEEQKSVTTEPEVEPGDLESEKQIDETSIKDEQKEQFFSAQETLSTSDVTTDTEKKIPGEKPVTGDVCPPCATGTGVQNVTEGGISLSVGGLCGKIDLKVEKTSETSRDVRIELNVARCAIPCPKELSEKPKELETRELAKEPLSEEPVLEIPNLYQKGLHLQNMKQKKNSRQKNLHRKSQHLKNQTYIRRASARRTNPRNEPLAEEPVPEEPASEQKNLHKKNLHQKRADEMWMLENAQPMKHENFTCYNLALEGILINLHWRKYIIKQYFASQISAGPFLGGLGLDL